MEDNQRNEKLYQLRKKKDLRIEGNIDDLRKYYHNKSFGFDNVKTTAFFELLQKADEMNKNGSPYEIKLIEKKNIEDELDKILQSGIIHDIKSCLNYDCDEHDGDDKDCEICYTEIIKNIKQNFQFLENIPDPSNNKEENFQNLKTLRQQIESKIKELQTSIDTLNSSKIEEKYNGLFELKFEEKYSDLIYYLNDGNTEKKALRAKIGKVYDLKNYFDQQGGKKSRKKSRKKRSKRKKSSLRKKRKGSCRNKRKSRSCKRSKKCSWTKRSKRSKGHCRKSKNKKR